MGSIFKALMVLAACAWCSGAAAQSAGEEPPSPPQTLQMTGGSDRWEEPSQTAMELAFWESIKTSDDPNVLRDYLERVERGEFSGVYRTIALARLAEIAEIAATRPAPSIPSPLETAVQRGIAETPALIQTAQLRCDVRNAIYKGGGTLPVGGQSVPITAYEVACKEGVGYFLGALADGSVRTYSCVALDEVYRITQHDSRCKLPENADIDRQMQRLVDRSGVPCTVSERRSLGTNPQHEVFEVRCRERSGYIVDLARHGSVQAYTCLAVETKYDCKFTPQAERQKTLLAWAGAADPACRVSAQRFAGITPDHRDFFEIGCVGRPGFFLDTKWGVMLGHLDCVQAKVEGISCTLTDYGQAMQARLAYYSRALRDHRIACDATDYVIMGTDKKMHRDVLEFACPQRPAGVLALIPSAKSTGKFESYDCFAAGLRRVACRLALKPALLAHLGEVLRAAGRPCVATEFQDHGLDAGDGDLIEVKCADGGFVIDLSADGNRALMVKTCAQTAATSNKCEIPGNA
ncbi:MAG TPA: hypothetical protein VG407_12665 [Caulobacteraceae bacterium]|jgi:hypothetical protein|nr:hypothetical protein [Caulobacteraceae bacterium]